MDMEEKEAQPAPEVQVIASEPQENQPDRPTQTENVSLQEMMRVMFEQLSQKMEDTNKSKETIKENNNKSSDKRWREEMINKGIRTYKTSIYHPSSNPAERVLREVGRILCTYCHDHKKME